jgi:iron complex transport system substrate-binding protein
VRIASLLASGTELVCALGQGASLVARSHECDDPAWVATLPSLSRPTFDVSGTSADIDRRVNEKLRAGEPLYAVDTERLRDLAPDIVITQVHCEVCAVNPAQVDPAHGWPGLQGWRTVAMRGGSLEGILDDFMVVAAATGCVEAGARLNADIRVRLRTWRDLLAGARRPSVVCLEWTDPIFPMGNWGPELVELAGGCSALGSAHAHSAATPWQRVVDVDPEVVVVAPCGFGLQRGLAEMPALATRPGWNDLRAVRQGQVYVADGNRYFNRSGPTVFESVGLLAEILHPDLVERRSEGLLYRRWGEPVAPLEIEETARTPGTPGEKH